MVMHCDKGSQVLVYVKYHFLLALTCSTSLPDIYQQNALLAAVQVAKRDDLLLENLRRILLNR